MKYATALLGSALVFVGIFVVTGILLLVIYPRALTPVQIGSLKASNILGVILGGLAAQSSFRATLRKWKTKQGKNSKDVRATEAKPE